MSWGEAVRLTRILTADPSSQIAAELGGWNYPLTRGELILLDHYDLTHAIGAAGSRQKPKPYPRPWPEKQSGRKVTKPSADLTQDEVLAALRFAGHTMPLPSAN